MGAKKLLTLDPGMPSALESESEPDEDSNGVLQSSTSRISMKILYHSDDWNECMISSGLRNRGGPEWSSSGSGMSRETLIRD
jgi:hypothetical protein